MESNGKPNQIQLSQETANLIQAADKSHWLEPREDKILAKGKGVLNTYWLVSTSETGGEAPKRGSASGATPQVRLDVKHHRLVDWNVDVLKNVLNLVVAQRMECKPDAREALRELEQEVQHEPTTLQEVREIVNLPQSNAGESVNHADFVLPEIVVEQLRDFITALSNMYRDNPFHSFEVRRC